MYSYEEAKSASTDYFGGDDLAATVFVDKYALRDNKGNLLEKDPSDMHRRLAKELTRIENKYPNPLQEKEIFEYLDRFGKIIPQGSPMAGIGNPYQIMSLSNCEVIDSPADSYGGICYTDQELAQLMKRRCVREDSFVIIKDKGPVPIKDVQIGDYVLSFNEKTRANEFNKVLHKEKTNPDKKIRKSIVFKNGELNITNDHPIAFYNTDINKIIYDIIGNNNKYQAIYNNSNYCVEKQNDDANTAWLLGAHIGDGSCNWRNNGKYCFLRTRINGDNENVINKYGLIFNYIFNKNCNPKQDTKKYYKSNVWTYTSCLHKNEAHKFIQLLDNQIGKKTYNCFIPKYINQNNIIPFLAGLVDSDGWITPSGRMEFNSVSKKLIFEIANWLSYLGVCFYISRKKTKRPNEVNGYTLGVYSDQVDFFNNISRFMCHEKKIKALLKSNNKFRQDKFYLSKLEKETILNKYNNMKWGSRSNNLSSIISILKKQDYICSLSLDELVKYSIIDSKQQKYIENRITIKEINNDTNDLDYYDLTIDHTNNFFTGNGSFYLVHNCGVGFDISTIRPKGLPTNNAARTTDGIGVFMERFSNTCREVAQNGRRGALMLSISVHHPEIETFIKIKNDLSKVTGANISIRYSDEFLEAVDKNKEYEVRFPIDYKENGIVPLYSAHIQAKHIWDMVIESNWRSSEPGSLFWDTILKETPAQLYADVGFNHVSVNPCAELVLSAYDSCRLLLVNTSCFVEQPFITDNFNWNNFRRTCYVAQKLMDDIVDLELEHVDKIIEKISNDPESEHIKKIELDLWEKIRKNCYNGRRTGTGLTAIGDTIAGLGMRYASDKSISFIERLYKELAIASYTASVDMAKDRGSFPVYRFDLEKDHPFLNKILKSNNILYNNYIKYGRRNIANTTTPPAGSTSILARLFNSNLNNTTSGIEPAYLLEYTRRKKINAQDTSNKADFIDQSGDKWLEYKIYHSGFNYWKQITGKDAIEESPYHLSTSRDVDWIAGVKLQAAAQKWVCHSISRTANVPHDISKDIVSNIYLTAWKSGCKGYTIYREGSRSGVLIENTPQIKGIQKTNAPRRPKDLPCKIFFPSIKGQLYCVAIGLLDGEPYELFTFKLDRMHKQISNAIIHRVKSSHYQIISTDGEVLWDDITSKCDHVEEALCRLISSGLRHGADVKFLTTQLSKSKGDLYSVGHVLARVLKKFIPDGVESKEKCPECSSELVYSEGCVKCNNCSFSKCG